MQPGHLAQLTNFWITIFSVISLACCLCCSLPPSERCVSHLPNIIITHANLPIWYKQCSESAEGHFTQKLSIYTFKPASSSPLFFFQNSKNRNWRLSQSKYRPYITAAICSDKWRVMTTCIRTQYMPLAITNLTLSQFSDKCHWGTDISHVQCENLKGK